MNHTRSGLLLLCSILIPCLLKAQFPGAGNAAGNAANMMVGHVYGKLLDDSTGKSIEGASIQVLQLKLDSATKKRKEVSVSLNLSNKKGEFSADKLPVMGNLQLRISALGYFSVEQKISFQLNMQSARNGDFSALLNGVDKDLGNIRLKRNEKNLLNVTVTATRPLLQLNADKKVYAVDKDLMSTGGTAVDVMKNVPSVQVDIEGNVTLRNGSPQILIDGRPTAMGLDQIPADQIATVEVISNPSAKYDAGSNNGVLNIVLKKNRNKGYNGNLRAGIDSRLRPNLGGDFNLRRNKLNFFVSGMVNLRKSKSEVTSDRTEWGQDYITLLQQQNNPLSTGYFAFGRAGMDYFIDNRNTVTLSGSWAHGQFTSTDLLRSQRDSFLATQSSSETGIRNIASDAHFTNKGASLSFKHNFAKAEKEWTADFNVNDIQNDNVSRYNNQFFSATQVPKGPVVYERASGAGSTRMFTAQTDFVNPFGKKQKIESGLRWTHRLNKSYNDNYIGFDPDQLIYIPGLFINYRFTDDVYAAYVNYVQSWTKYSVQVGLRAESSSFDANLLSKNQPFSTQYPISLFPSLYATHKLTSKQELQLNYSRKINRPGFFQLIPFTDYSDSLNLSVGNPNLQPEFSHLAELVYVNNFKSNQNLLISWYGKRTDQLITRYQYRDLNPDPAKPDSVLFTSFANANRSWVTGFEITSKNKLTKWWEMTTNLNLFYVKVVAENIAGSGTQAQSSWFAKMNHSFKFPAHFSLQLNGDYQAKTILPSGSGSGSRGMGGMSNMWMGASISNAAQGYIKPVYGLDIALKKDFLKNNAASITLQLSDVFKTRYSAFHSATSFFEQDTRRIRDPQIVRLNFSWRFGKLDAGLYKRKNLKGEMENMQNLQQGVNQ